MARTNRLGLAILGVVALTLVASSAASAAFSAPILLRQADHLRVKDAANDRAAVAVGWQEGSSPGSLKVRISLDGGASFKRTYSVAGLGSAGLSLAICSGQVWAASVARNPGDADKDSDVMLSRRALKGGGATQLFLTQPGASHAVRAPDIACVGDRLLAIAWLDRASGQTKAYLLLRDQASLVPSATNQLFDLGAASIKGGIAVAATDTAAYVAWSRGSQQDLRFKRIRIGTGSDPTITPTRTVMRATGAAVWPRLAARGQKVVLAYTDDGQLKYQLSADSGRTFTATGMLVKAGRTTNPARATSADIRSSRIVVEALRPPPRSPGGDLVPYRIETSDSGASWSKILLGNRGSRIGVLRPLKGGSSRLLEAWHDDGDIDVLRFQRQVS